MSGISNVGYNSHALSLLNIKASVKVSAGVKNLGGISQGGMLSGSFNADTSKYTFTSTYKISKNMPTMRLPSYNTLTWANREWGVATRTAPAMSEGEFEQAIINQAKKDAAAGRFMSGDEFMKLETQYISVVSPDRKGAIARSSMQIPRDPYEQTQGRVEVKNEAGEVISVYSGYNEWVHLGTKAEKERTAVFSNIYVKAHKEAMQEIEAAKSGGSADSALPRTIDVTA